MKRLTKQELRAIDSALAEIRAEMIKAYTMHGGFYSAHEGASVIREEHDEFWDEIRADNMPFARKECVQLGAMALKFLVDSPAWIAAGVTSNRSLKR